MTLKNGNTELYIVPALHLHLDSFQLNQTYQLDKYSKNFTRHGINDSVQPLHCRESAFLDICISILKGYHSLFNSSWKELIRDWLKKTMHWSEHWCFSKRSWLNTSTVFHLPESEIKKRQKEKEEKKRERDKKKERERERDKDRERQRNKETK